MAQFIVGVKEVHIQDVLIDAIDENEAIAKVCDGDGTYYMPPRYYIVLDPNSQEAGPWSVERKQS